jgi:hypothetical protein
MNFKTNRVFQIGALAIALGLLAALAPALRAQGLSGRQECSAASLQGYYGSYRHGTAPYGAVAAQGLYYFDGDGGWNLVLNISRNGEISTDEYWEGGYAVNADCSGEIDDGARIVIVDGGQSVYLVSLLDGFTMYEVWTRIHNAPGN